MKDKDIGDIVGGILLMALGVFTVFYAQRYTMGRLQIMGPGFFPAALGYILMILGGVIALPAFKRKGSNVTVNFLGAFWVILGLLAFASTLNILGLILATVLSVITATFASTLSWLSILYLSACIAAVTYLIFILGLNMIMPVLPTFFAF